MDSSKKSLALRGGGAVLVTNEADEQSVEIHSTEGDLMLRVRMTPDGPVVQLEAARLELVAKREVAVQCESFELNTTKSATFTSQGKLSLHSKGKMVVDSGVDADLHVTGKIIHLN